MRRFGRMTKEMRPSHREDVLTHALVYYGIRTKKRLGISTQHSFLYDSVFSILFVHLAKPMLVRWERTHNTKAVAEETFANLMPGIDRMLVQA